MTPDMVCSLAAYSSHLLSSRFPSQLAAPQLPAFFVNRNSPDTDSNFTPKFEAFLARRWNHEPWSANYAQTPHHSDGLDDYTFSNRVICPTNS